MTAYGLSKEQNVDLIVRTALEYGITDKRQIAYMLASAQHESDDFNTSREYNGPQQALRLGYGGGENYYGRGYVQVTHDRNYARMDHVLGLEGRLIANPDLVATDSRLGAQTLVVGMARGLYTGVALHKYIGGEYADYENARRTVNGTDKADLIASYARDWEVRITDIIDRVSQQGISYRPLPGSSFATDGEFRVGERGIEVQYIQARLDLLGYRDADGRRLSTDGDFGSRTEQALRAFQADRGLNPTGVADQQSLRALGLQQYLRDADVAHIPEQAEGTPRRNVSPTHLQQRSDPPLLPTTQTLQPGDRGAAVLALQEHLRLVGATDRNGGAIAPDRDYGPRTREAVEQFQLWTGRPTTGVADPDTLAALQEHARFAARRQARGTAPGTHLADNLEPVAPDPADAAEVRTPQAWAARQDPAAPDALEQGRMEQGRTIAAVQTGLIQLGYQHRIGQPLNVNGVNDEATRQAVTAFQAERNLPATGRPDAATRQALQQVLAAQQQARQARRKEPEQAQTAPARTPADPDHPDHALLEKLRGLVRGLDRQAGKAWDEGSERMAASALVMARQMGFSEKDELHLFHNRSSEKYAAGELLHLARTGPTASVDPGANRIHMPMDEALSKPVEERYRQVQDIARQQELERQQALARGPDEPSRGGPVR